MSGLAAFKKLADAASTVPTANSATGASSSGAVLEESLRASLPLSVQAIVPAAKLNAQCPFFVVPAWAALPNTAHYLEVRRDGQLLPPLSVDQYPYYLFGNSSVCDYRIEHPSSSRVHAALVYHGEKKTFLLVDLKSTNGVLVDGKRLEAAKPTVVCVDSTMQFGLSTRTYTLRSGRPASRHEPPLAVVAEDASRKRPRPPQEEPPAVKDVTTPSPNEEAPPPPPPAAERHLLHLLIKHKDVKRPQSMAPRNKGEAISRTVKAAFELAASVVALHTTAEWTKTLFEAAVQEFSECGTAKKGGDLGTVSAGDFGADFDEGTKGLLAGAVSKPFETELGVHVVFYCES